MMTTEDKPTAETDEKVEEAASQQGSKIIQGEDERYLRLLADFDNFRKRSRKETANIRINAMNEFVKELFPVKTDLERALDISEGNIGSEYYEGFKLILHNMNEILEEYGVEEIYPEGDIFDPFMHEAFIVKEDGTVPVNTILEVLEKGYRHGHVILKPARVVVSVYPGS